MQNHYENGTTTVSVVIAAHNCEMYIPDALESTLGQTLSDLEVIVIDDASTDDTVSVVKSFSDPRIRILRNDRNVGPASSRNRGIDAAAGRWIAIVDADDWMAPERFESLVDMGERYEIDIAGDNIFVVDENTPVAFDRDRPKLYDSHLPLIGEDTDVDVVDYIRGNIPGPHCPRYGLIKPIIRRSMLERHGLRYPESMYFTEDVAFYILCLAEGARMRISDEGYYYYRYHPDQLSKGDPDAMAAQQLALSAGLMEFFQSRGHYAECDALTEMEHGILQERNFQKMMLALKSRSYRRAATHLARRPYYLLQWRTLHTIYMLMKGFQF